MAWNWELPEWPKFSYDFSAIAQQEREFLLGTGSACAFLKSIQKAESLQFIVEILSDEGVESAKMEGELLDRESLQSSIKRHFGLPSPLKQSQNQKEARMGNLLYDVYDSFEQPLTNEMLWQWHDILFRGMAYISDCGTYRTHEEPMQILSHRSNISKVFFEAPPSKKVANEMKGFIAWFNQSKRLENILGRAAIAHVYFESIHPFEDGNGRIGRVLIEKILSQGTGHPVLLALSKVFEKRKKEYYTYLERCNRTLNIQPWTEFFVDAVLEGQRDANNLLQFIIEKSKLLNALSGQMNVRQEKVLLRMFSEGLGGFKGGLSAENYIAITKSSRATATRDLADLVHKGALIKTGELRHTRYWLNVASSPKSRVIS